MVGCDESEAKGIKLADRIITHTAGAGDEVIDNNRWAKSTHPNAQRFFAPSIKEAKEFPWYNKPWSFHYWVKEANITGDTIVLIGS